MKKFVINVLCCGIVFGATLVFVVIARIVASQAKLNEIFSVPQGTRVLCIGNSHTGCTWYEAPEFKDRVLWTSATGFVMHYMRFREFERRGVLDSDIKYCIIDCDGPAMGGCSIKLSKENFLKNLPFAWRYIGYEPVNRLDLALYVLSHCSQDFTLDEIPPDQVPDWTTRTKEEQESNLIGQYGKTLGDWKTGYASDWQEVFLWMVADIKKRCDDHGVQLICFAAPLTTASPARANPTAWERETKMIERVKALGIEYYDFRLDCADNLFRDSHHLLKNSSYDFTSRFFNKVLKVN